MKLDAILLNHVAPKLVYIVIEKELLNYSEMSLLHCWLLTSVPVTFADQISNIQRPTCQRNE